MLILYVAPKYDYGDPARGLGFEHFNFYETIRRLGHDVLYFDWPTLEKKHGFAGMSRRFAEVVKSEKPQLTFCMFTGDQIEQHVMRQVSKSGLTTTVNWYCDDHFNFESFSRRWTPCFNWVVTTAQCTLPKYEKLGLKNVIKSQWGCNPFLYYKQDLPLKYDVTFVGARHGNRPMFVDALRQAGVKVECWGSGWSGGRLSQDEMIAVFNQSRINLNFTNGASPPTPFYQWRMRMKHSPIGRLENSSIGLMVKQQLKRMRPKPKTAPGAIAAEGSTTRATPIDLSKLVPDGMLQIKGRTFEVPGCGGFLMTSDSENLTEYLADGRESSIFQTGAELVEKARYFLDHEAQRSAVASAGYARTLAEHTYVHRMRDVFSKTGMPVVDVDAVLGGKVHQGRTEMVD